MGIWTVHIRLGGYVAADHRRAYGAAADWLEAWLDERADAVTWSETVDEDGGLVDARVELEGFDGAADDLADGVDNLAATVEEAGMVLRSATATAPDGTSVPLQT